MTHFGEKGRAENGEGEIINKFIIQIQNECIY